MGIEIKNPPLFAQTIGNLRLILWNCADTSFAKYWFIDLSALPLKL